MNTKKRGYEEKGQVKNKTWQNCYLKQHILYFYANQSKKFFSHTTLEIFL